MWKLTNLDTSEIKTYKNILIVDSNGSPKNKELVIDGGIQLISNVINYIKPIKEITQNDYWLYQFKTDTTNYKLEKLGW